MDTLFWFFSKLLWWIFSPSRILLFLLALGTVLLWTKKNIAGRWLLSVAVVVIFVLSFRPFGQGLLFVLESRFSHSLKLPEELDGVVVLAGSENSTISKTWGQPSLNGSSERLITFISLAKRYPEAKLLFVGGVGSVDSQVPTPEGTARMIFEQVGLDASRVIFESKSHNTFQGGVASYELIKPKAGEKWVLITSAFHMPRSVGVYRQAGWEVIPYPVDFGYDDQIRFDFSLGHMAVFSRALHEWIGVFVYGLTGKTTELFPGPK